MDDKPRSTPVPATVWVTTPGMLERLVELHAEGRTLLEIAGTINAEYRQDFSRSAISGKIHRMRLRGGSHEERKPRQRRKVMEDEQTKATPEALPPLRPVVIALPEPEPKRRERRPPLDGGLSLDLMETNHSTCKWPFGVVSPFTFCGYPTEPEKVYCPDHCDIAYNAGRSRR